jgi:hypothetical protein
MLIANDLTAALAAGLLFAASHAHAQPNACGSGHLVTIEMDGKVSRGSKDRLRRAVESGTPVRVGWTIDANKDGVPDLTHWADGGFLSVFEGEVFAQLEDIQRQSPVAGQARIRMPAGRHRWTGLIGTTGALESHFDDGAEPTATRARSTWCVDPRASSSQAGRLLP